VSWDALQPGEGGGKHNRAWDVAPVGSTVHGFLWAGSLAPAWCPEPIARGISVFWDALHILPETNGTVCCLGHTESTGFNWPLCI